MTEGGEGIGAEVGGLKPGGARSGDTERDLEVLVEGIEEAVGEALTSPEPSVRTAARVAAVNRCLAYPEEEQDGDQKERVDGLSQRELSSPRPLLVVRLQRVLLQETHGVCHARWLGCESQKV